MAPLLPSGALGKSSSEDLHLIQTVPETEIATITTTPAICLADDFLPGPWFREFSQDYGDGIRVKKRGLDASALVVRKYDIAADEVLALSTHDGRRRAMTVFHFHPDFPLDRRRRYMEAHREGYDVAHDVTRHMDALKAHRQTALRKRFSRAGRAVTMGVHAIAMFFLAHYSSGR